MVFRNPKLLIIDDSKTDAEDLSINLTECYKNLIYKRIDNITEFQIAIHESTWDVIIAEYSLSQFDSLNALDLLKRSNKEIPFIIYSKNTSEQVALAAIRYGASDYLYKGHSARLMLAIERELKYINLKCKQRQTESQIFHMTYYDELTGLPSYKLFCEKASGLLSRQIDRGKMVAVYFIEMERLPRISNTRGHAIADALIKQFVYHLSVYMGNNCLFTRLEGERFIFFKGDISNIYDAQMFANEILKLASVPIMLDDLEFYISLNIGISISPKDGDKIEVLLANLENTLSLDRGSWRNNYKFYTKEMGEASLKRTLLGASLRRAIEKNELVLYYQPIVDVPTGVIIGAESLVRWNHPEYGLLSPDKFIPLAEGTSVIVEMGKWVLLEACKQAKFWRNEGGDPISIAVNISAIELDQPHYLPYLAEVLKRTKLEPEYLELEITESVLIRDTEESIRVLRELKKMGVKIAIDNFGVGYSSLSCLKKYPIDVLKIDRSFAKGMLKNSDSSSIVNAIVALAKSLNISALAKGIETQEQLDFLNEIECSAAQGFLFSHPVTGKGLLSLIKQRKTGTFS